ncbi:hypothetical protein BX600DRAFT_437642 [Xylariales sp. PMI_506]|nr:hypothetical protein BX600DRAFT_437642 [Xylariales sp. PMI_506]
MDDVTRRVVSNGIHDSLRGCGEKRNILTMLEGSQDRIDQTVLHGAAKQKRIDVACSLEQDHPKHLNQDHTCSPAPSSTSATAARPAGLNKTKSNYVLGESLRGKFTAVPLRCFTGEIPRQLPQEEQRSYPPFTTDWNSYASVEANSSSKGPVHAGLGYSALLTQHDQQQTQTYPAHDDGTTDHSTRGDKCAELSASETASKGIGGYDNGARRQSCTLSSSSSLLTLLSPFRSQAAPPLATAEITTPPSHSSSGSRPPLRCLVGSNRPRREDAQHGVGEAENSGGDDASDPLPGSEDGSRTTSGSSSFSSSSGHGSGRRGSAVARLAPALEVYLSSSADEDPWNQYSRGLWELSR